MSCYATSPCRADRRIPASLRRSGTRVWREAVTPNGLIGLNAVSPQAVPEAFWCLRKTVRAVGLSALPYRACIPSFRAHGYGAWGFLLASPQPLAASLLHDLDCPVPTRQADLRRLGRGARFSRAERGLEARMPIHTLENGVLLPLLLNPGLPQREQEAAQHPYDLNPLLRAIPILHPSHTRLMVETLAKQVVGTISALDLRKLLDAVLKRANRLPQEIRSELIHLREFLNLSPFQMHAFGAWCGRLFAALVLLMTLANAIAPDNAFAKGSFGGGGHSISSSVGHSSFGGGRGISSGGRATSGSFSGSRGFGSFGRSGGSFGGSGRASSSFAGSRGFMSDSVFTGRTAAPQFTGSGFRSSYGIGHTVDMQGVSYSSRSFYYYGGGHYRSYTTVNNGTRPSPETHTSLFAAAKDMFVLDNGDVVIALSDSAYLLVTNGTVALMHNKSPAPLMMLYPDPTLFQNIRQQIEDQGNSVEQAITARQDWLSWVGWTSAVLPGVATDRKELNNLLDLDRRLHAAYDRLGDPPKDAVAATAPPDDNIELFIDCQLRSDGSITIRDDKGVWIDTDGATLTQTGKMKPCPPLLTAALNSVLVKFGVENDAAVLSDQNDLRVLATDLQTLEKDLDSYKTFQYSNSPGTLADYGTEEIPVSDAINRTQKDIDKNAQDTKNTQADIARRTAFKTQLPALLAQYKPKR